MSRTQSLRLLLAAGAALAVASLFALGRADAAAGPAAASGPAAESWLATAGILGSAPLKFIPRSAAISRILPPHPQLYHVADGFKWVEGPVWARGSLFFAEIPSNSIRRWTPGHGTSIFLQPSGYQGKAPYGGPEPGSNGLTLDARGRLTVAGHARRDVYRIESFRPGAPITILADSYHGKRLNSPNDLVYRSDGSLYFTDPPYGLRTQNDSDPHKQLKVNGVYRIPNALRQKPGAPPDRAALQLLITRLPRPNGIAFSPHERYLYVDNTQPRKLWMRYRVLPNGTLTDAKVFYDATSSKLPGGPDGMKVDVDGNIYSAGPGGVWIFSPQGKPLATLLIPERVANLAWGGPHHRTLFIAASTSIYCIRTKIPGEPVVRKP